MIAHVLIVVLLVLLIGSLPLWPWSRRWGWYGMGGVGATLLVVVLLLLCNVI